MPRTQAEPSPGATAQAQLRRAHAGKWLAWDLHERRILAVGDTPEDVHAAALTTGADRFIYDWVPPVTDRSGGSL